MQPNGFQMTMPSDTDDAKVTPPLTSEPDDVSGKAVDHIVGLSSLNSFDEIKDADLRKRIHRGGEVLTTVGALLGAAPK